MERVNFAHPPLRHITGGARRFLRDGPRTMFPKAFLRTSARGFASKSTPGLKNVVLIDGCRIPFQPCTRLLPAPYHPMALKPCARCACGARQTGPRTMWT